MQIRAQISMNITSRVCKFRTGVYQYTHPCFRYWNEPCECGIINSDGVGLFSVHQLVYMGITGAVNPKWQPGDVIVPERWYYHDESVYSNPEQGQLNEYVLPDYCSKFLEEQASDVQDHIPQSIAVPFIHPDEVRLSKGYG